MYAPYGEAASPHYLTIYLHITNRLCASHVYGP